MKRQTRVLLEKLIEGMVEPDPFVYNSPGVIRVYLAVREAREYLGLFSIMEILEGIFIPTLLKQIPVNGDRWLALCKACGMKSYDKKADFLFI